MLRHDTSKWSVEVLSYKLKDVSLGGGCCNDFTVGDDVGKYKKQNKNN